MDKRLLTNHNGTFQISIPTEYVSHMGWVSGEQLALQIADDHKSLVITSPLNQPYMRPLHGLKHPTTVKG